MNTAEVAIEHILAGMLALCAFALPFISRPQVSGRLSQNAFIVAVLGAAYLLGVVFDRLADTILGPMEHYARMKLAKNLKKDPSPSQPDPFPQDLLEFSLRAAEGGRLAWMDSLRGRIRTCRALCVLGAPAAMGIATFMRWNTHEVGLHWKPHSLVAVNLVLVLSLVLIQRVKRFKPPRTKDLTCLACSDEPLLLARKQARLVSSLYFLMVILSLAVTAWILPGSYWKRFGILLGGAAVVGLSLLAWHQITKTYMSFVARQLKYRD